MVVAVVLVVVGETKLIVVNKSLVVLLVDRCRRLTSCCSSKDADYEAQREGRHQSGSVSSPLRWFSSKTSGQNGDAGWEVGSSLIRHCGPSFPHPDELPD